MAEIDIILQNYSQILNLSISFLGIILALFFTLIALPLQNILGRYSQDLVNRVNRDKYLVFCFIFFIILFAYDFTLLILPKSPDYIIISFLGGLTSLIVFAFLVVRVFYLLDVRNQINDIGRRIIKEIKGKKTRIRIFESNTNLIDKLKNETEIIFDIIQKATREDRFEIVDFGLKEAEKIANTYICVKGINLSREYVDSFLDHIYDRLIDTQSIVTKTNHPKIMNSIVYTIGSITKEILSTDKIPEVTNQWGPLSSLTLAFIESLKNICIGPEISKRTSYASGNACDQLIEIGKVSMDHKYAYRTVDVVSELAEISKTATQMNFYRGNHLAQSSNQGIIYLQEYSLENLDKIEIDKEYILTNITDEIMNVIREYLENGNIHIISSPENIKPFVNPQADHNITVVHLKAIQKFKQNKDTNIIIGFMNKFMDMIIQTNKIGLEYERYYDIKDISDNSYIIGFNLINSINGKDQFEEQLSKTLQILYKPISTSLKTREHITPFTDYLNNYTSLLGLIFFKENIDRKLIENSIENIRQDLNVLSQHSGIYPYIRLIGLWIFKWMPNSEYLIMIKEILKTKEVELVREEFINDNEKELYPKPAGEYWSLKLPYNNENALIKPYNVIKMEFDEINRILFNSDDIINFETYLKE